MFNSEVKIYSTFDFVRGGGTARVATRSGGGERRDSADRVCIESVFSMPRTVANVEPQAASEEQTQWSGLTTRANPLAAQISGKPRLGHQVGRSPLCAPGHFVADVTAMSLEHSQ